MQISIAIDGLVHISFFSMPVQERSQMLEHLHDIRTSALARKGSQ